MKALVTGSAGFIGSHLSERLLADDWEVVGLDNFDDFYSPKVKHANMARCLKNKKFKLVEGDIRDAKCVGSILGDGDVDIIVHLAAKAGVRPSIEDPVSYVDVNVNGTVVMLEAAKEFGVKKFVFASSSSIYGNNEVIYY